MSATQLQLQLQGAVEHALQSGKTTPGEAIAAMEVLKYGILEMLMRKQREQNRIVKRGDN